MALKQTAVIDDGIGDFASFYEKPVRFSLCYCDYSRYCISKISEKNERKGFYSTLGYFEKMDWKTIRSLPRERGISIEKAGEGNYNLFAEEIENFGFKNPTIGHFRFGGNCGRVFGFMSSGLFYILKVDASGEINH